MEEGVGGGNGSEVDFVVVVMGAGAILVIWGAGKWIIYWASIF